MENIRFEWDEEKSKINRKKHGVSFNEAKSVFLDENGLLISDPDHSGEEDRFILLGMSVSLNMLVVCHCYRSNNETVRIISARKANKYEVKTYSGR